MKTTQSSPPGRRRSIPTALAATTLALAWAVPAGAQHEPMSGSQHEPMSGSQHEPMSGSQRESMSGSQREQAGQVAGSAEEMIRQWPEASRRVAQEMVRRYGEPDAVTEDMLVWKDNGPWLRTVVHREPVQHNFPMPHEDVLEQVVAYEVPEEKFSDLARFDGSISAHRTKGELAALCGREEANTLALNLAHDIIEGRRSVEEARDFYARAIQELMRGEEPEYAMELRFEPETVAETADPDEQVISERVATAKPKGSTGSTGAAAAAGMAGAAAGTAAGTAAGATERATGAAERATEAPATGARGADAARSGPAAAATTRGAPQGRSIAEMLSDELEGKRVVSADGEVVGEVEDVETDQQGRHVAQIDLDGFLGVGEDDDLRLPLAELTLTDDGDLVMSMTRDELRSKQRKGESGKREKHDYREHELR